MHYLVFGAVILQSLGILAYIRDMFRGSTKPNRITWLGWTVAPFIATAAALSNGANWEAVLPTFMTGFMPFLVLVLSFFFREAYWKLNRFDYLCGLFSALALILWLITSNAAIAVIFAILADLNAAVPTLFKAWKYPETETATTFLVGTLAVITTFFTIESPDFTNLAFPVYLVLMNLLISFLILRKRIHIG